nr:E3 ubiquitin-protein ligase BRE1-like 2 isoform X3 [Physcomitrium patens]|eukprot:XP_024399175.1 E3 ubiquitin-protein ligase BRE1-like 2 isoform X3 [Physcomitrella patens]
MGSTEEPDRKRRHLNNHSVSPPVKKQPFTPSAEEKKVDAQMLQYQNHKLSQQLEVQRNEITVLEGRLKQLHSKQALFDENLSIVSRVWNQVVDDLELLTVRANTTTNGIQVSGSVSKDRNDASVLPAQTFLQRLLDTGATESSIINGSNGSIESGHSSREATTYKTMKDIVQSIDYERARNEDLVSNFRNGIASNGGEAYMNGRALKLAYKDVSCVNRSLVKANEELYVEAKKLRGLVDDLHVKHRELSAELGTCRDLQAKDQAELKRLKGELEEACADLESNRRQLAALRSQDAMLSGPPTPSATPTRKTFEFGEGGAGQVKVSKENCELEAGLEEAKTLAARRLTELEEAMNNQLDVIQKIQHLQDELDDQESIMTSRQYQSLHEKVQYLRGEVEKHQAMVDELQGERISLLRREKEAILKAEAGDAARRACILSDARADDLELKLQQCMSDCDTLQLRVTDAAQASARKESVADLKEVISNLDEDIAMMQGQLYDFKETGSAVHSLRAQLHSLHAKLERKSKESRELSDQHLGQVPELNSIQNEIRGLQDSEKELKLILNMYNKESTDPREVRELQQANCRARAEVQRLQLALDEHSLELRVKEANEAEAACQQKLAAVEAEIAELRQSLEASYRVAHDLKEKLHNKKDEEETYTSEIRNIGQAYDDVHSQNKRLLQEIIERDEYNAQLMSESLKAKQLQASLQAEKQVLNARMQHANATADLHKQRIARLEEQARMLIHELAKATDESRQQSSAMESAKRKAVEMEKELSSANSALAAANQVLEERGQKLLNVKLQLEKERFEKRRVQEELDVLNVKSARLNSLHDGGPMVELLQEELNDYKAILQCSVCHDRNFQAVITKCYHLFCSPCIQRSLDSRHRKCPGCGVPFGQNDVRTVYI